MSSAGSKHASLSSPPPSSQSATSKKANEKMKIIVEQDGNVVGDYAKKWSSRSGDFVRACIPIIYGDWRQVPENFRNDVWNNLMDEFELELDVPPEVARPMLEKAWPQKFRTHKNTLRGYLSNGGEELPKGIDPDHWKKFVENESNPKKKDQNIKNSENRQQLQYSHCLRRCSYAQKTYSMKEQEPEKSIKRVDAWMAGHEKQDGSVLESAKSYYAQVKEAKRKSEEDGSSNTLENDELTQVFGKDSRGRLRGVGSHISKKQFIQIGIGKAKEVAMKKEKEGGVALKDEILSSVNSRFDTFQVDLKNEILSSMQTMFTALTNGSKESSPQMMVTPRSELGSNSVHRPSHLPQNLANIFTSPSSPVFRPTPSDKPPVILLDKYFNELAKGHVVTDASAKICHGKKVGLGEKKVWVDEVMEPDARLWEAPQDGNHTLSAYVAGGYLIWLDSWLKYI